MEDCLLPILVSLQLGRLQGDRERQKDASIHSILPCRFLRTRSMCYSSFAGLLADQEIPDVNLARGANTARVKVAEQAVYVVNPNPCKTCRFDSNLPPFAIWVVITCFFLPSAPHWGPEASYKTFLSLIPSPWLPMQHHIPSVRGPSSSGSGDRNPEGWCVPVFIFYTLLLFYGVFCGWGVSWEQK